MKRKELVWVDSFFRKSKDYFFVREEDKVIILPPNRVYKLNETGYSLVKYLYSGKSITQCEVITDGERTRDVHDFFCDLRGFFNGCPELPDKRRAVKRIPFGFDFTTLPVLGEIAITYKCNNRCLFCYADCGNGPDTRNEMSLKEIKYIIKVFREKAKIPFFSFTGGEPLVRPDLEKMIRYAYKTGLKVNLITNGTLVTEKRAVSLYKSGLRTAQVSIESHIPQIHDHLTGNEGSLERTLQGIKYLQQVGISVQTNTTLTQLNIKGIETLPMFLRNSGITRFSMNLYIPSGRKQYSKELFFPYSKIGPVIETIRKEASRQDLTFYWYSPVPYCYYNPVARGLGNKSCAAMDGLISVSPQGNVLPCSSYPESLGNLLKEDFNTIWFSGRGTFFKQKLFAPDECISCDKFTACQSACPLYWQFAGTGEIKQKGQKETVCLIKKEIPTDDMINV
ncbi:MAG: radical SAM protein [Spirochaetales bacterium]|nr:radical SAM protein [Spirochaetales bacterium]